MAANNGIYLDVDISDFRNTIEMMHNELKESQFQALMRRTFNETGRRVKTILRQDLPVQYEARPGWIGSNVGSARIGASGMNCTIPIKGARGVLGTRFSVTGGTSRGWQKKGVRRIINAKIVKGQSSTLPPVMENQGKQPPFRVKGKKLVFTRKSKKCYPIAHVAGIGIPQMPMNRSESEVKRDIREYLIERLDHNFMFMFHRG